MNRIDMIDSLPRHPTKKNKLRRLSKVKRIVVHCTDRDWTLDQLVEFDLGPNHISDTGLASCSYHHVIMKDGTVYDTVPHEEVTPHAGGYNTNSIAIAMMFRTSSKETGKSIYPPTPKQMKINELLAAELCLKYSIYPDMVQGHRELKGTGWFFNSQGSKVLRKSCPGLPYNLDKMRTMITINIQMQLDILVDGICGPKTKRAIGNYQQRN